MKTVLKIVLALVVLILVVPAFLPSESVVERTAKYNVSNETMFNFVSDLNNYTKWNPWFEFEPSTQVQVTGSGVGSVYTWKGDKTGEGSMTIASLTPPTQVDVQLVFLQPFPSQAMVYWKIEPDEASGGSIFTWQMRQEHSYFQRYFGIMMDGMIGKDFERGLELLKKSVE